MRATILIGGGLSVLLSACHLDPARSCSQDTDCDGNGYCDPSTKTCVASLCTCGVGQACVRGACAEAHTDVKLTASPFVAGEVGRSVQLTAQFEPANALPHVDPDAVEVEVALGGSTTPVLLRAVDAGIDGLYAGTWQPEVDGGQYVLSVDAGFPNTAALDVRANLGGPPLSLQFIDKPAPSGNYADPAGSDVYPYRRDQQAQFEVISDSTVDPASFHVFLGGTDGGLAEITPTSVSSCDGGFCADFTVDLSKPVMNAFRAVFPLEVEAANALQNVSSLDAGIGVTRWKWRFPTPDGLAITATPAVDYDGTVYIGTDGFTGTLYAVSPDGEERWRIADGGAVEGAIAIGAPDAGGRIYVAFNRPSGWGGYTVISAINSDGSIGVTCPVDGGVTSAPAIEHTDWNEPSETGIFISNAGKGYVVAIRPQATLASNQCAAIPVVLPVGPQSNVVATGNGVEFPAQNANEIQYERLDPTLGWLQTPPQFTAPVPINQLAVYDGGIVGSSTNLSLSLFAQLFDGGGAWQIADPSSTAASFGPVVDAAGVAYFGAGSSIGLAVSYDDSSIRIVPSDLSIQNSMVLGEGGKILIASTAGIAAWNRDLSLTWSDNTLGLGGVTASPIVDCSRDGGVPRAGVPGVLYVAGQANLYSFVIDSRGIDTSAAWPKYQHDPRNSGNVATDLSEFACP